MSNRPSLVSRLLFLWTSPFVHRNTKTALTAETLLDLPPDFDAVEQLDRLKKALVKQAPQRAYSLLFALLNSVHRELLKVFFLSLCLLVIGLVSPLILRQLLLSLEGRVTTFPSFVFVIASFTSLSPLTIYSLGCSIALFLSASLSTISVHHLFFNQVGTAAKMQTSLRAIIFEKAMRLARSERRDSPSGHIMSLMINDANKIWSWGCLLHATWYQPLQLSLALFLLYRFVGVSGLVGAFTLALLVGVSALLVRQQNNIRREVLRLVDKRVGFTAEVLSHIKMVKFQAWEEPLQERISTLRQREVEGLRRINRLASVAGLVSNMGPPLALVGTFSVFAARGGELTPSTVFPAMGLILLLRMTLNTLPDTIANTIEAIISLGRIERFLGRREHGGPRVVEGIDVAIRIAQARFEWQQGEVALTIPELTVRKGELIAVVGSVGGGKTALLLGLLNELPPSTGSVELYAAPGYVSQQPWIVSDSIRHNILAGRPFDELLFHRALKASCLDLDLFAFPQGDATEIGERGVNLSGGQRQRIALARAFYAQAEMYLFDDPLSALDPAVANAVFDRLIKEELCGTTRVLVTHRLEYALRSDRVLIVENGSIIEDGAPSELIEQGGRFSELVGVHQEMATGGAVAPEKNADQPLDESGVSPENGKQLSSENTSTQSVIAGEEREVGAIAPRVVFEYLQIFAPGGLLVLLILMLVGRHAVSLTTDLWLASYSRGSISSAYLFISGYCGLALLLAFFHFMRWYLFLSAGLRAGVSAHSALLHGILAAPLRFFEENPVGRILNRFSRDLETIEVYLPRTLLDCTHCALEVVVVCGFLLFIDPRTVIVLVPLFLSYFWIQKKIRPTGREAQRLESIARSPIFVHYAESLNGVDTIRSSGLVRAFTRRLDSMLNHHARTWFTLTSSARWVGLRLEFLAAVVVLAGGVAVSLTPSSAIPTALVGLLLTYAINVSGSMNWFVRSLVQAESHLTSYERITYYASTPPESRSAVIPPPDWPLHGEIKLHDLSVRYRPELSPALNRVTCTIPAGKRVGVIGRTGSGKSTLILALARLVDISNGHVEIDGVNTSTLSLAALRSALTIVPQEPVLFSGSLRMALDPLGLASDDEIRSVLFRVELESFVRSLPKGLDFELQEGGSNLSSGQRQLLCLARALLRGSRIIVLDEATAQIDVETDACIQRTIRREFAQSTVVVIAHRLGTVIDSDFIMVLERGELQEFGSPSELMEIEGSRLGEFMREMIR